MTGTRRSLWGTFLRRRSRIIRRRRRGFTGRRSMPRGWRFPWCRKSRSQKFEIRKEEFIAQKTCYAKAYLTPRTPFGMTGLLEYAVNGRRGRKQGRKGE